MGHANPYMYGQTPEGKQKPLQVDDTGRLILSPGDASANNVDTVVKGLHDDETPCAEPCLLIGLIVVTAGSAPGTINDANSVGGINVNSAVLTIPDVVGTVPLPYGGIPLSNGLSVAPGSGQVVTVIFR